MIRTTISSVLSSLAGVGRASGGVAAAIASLLVLAATPAAAQDRVAEAGGATIRGVIYDSIRAGPVPDAVVEIPTLGRRTVTNDHGVYVLRNVPPGGYGLALSYPWLESLGFEVAPMPLIVEPGDSILAQDLVIPSFATLVADRCERDGTPEGSFALMGVVRDAESATPLPGARVVISTTPSGPAGDPALEPMLRAVTGTAGLYLLCRVPLGSPVEVRVSFLGQEGEAVRTTFRTPGAMQLDLTVPLEGGRGDERGLRVRTRRIDGGMGSGRIFGTLRNSETGTPIRDAEVRIGDVEAPTVLTDAQGRFTFGGLSPGRHLLEVSHLGYGSHSAEFELEGPTPAAVEVEVAPEAIELEPLVVTVRALTPREIANRRTGGRARVMLREDIEGVAAAFHAGDLLRRLPGVRVTEIHGPSGQSLCIESSRGPATFSEAGSRCAQMPVYVDGLLVSAPEQILRSIPPDHVESIEVLDPATAGPLIPGTRPGASVIVIYTRGNGPYAAARPEAP